ncbi:MAG: hypothetical protein NC332_02445 [Firmicutes bacterium]|nr:hypothetical protein [Bacillota bacterium]
MKEYDRVIVTVEKEKYVCDGVHKGMEGWICDARIICNQRLVCFDGGEVNPFPIIPIKEEDLKVVWESHERQVGDKIILLVSKYQNIGFNKGLKGILLAKEPNDKWLVRFAKQEGLAQETELYIDKNDFFVDD